MKHDTKPKRTNGQLKLKKEAERFGSKSATVSKSGTKFSVDVNRKKNYSQNPFFCINFGSVSFIKHIKF